MKTQRFRHALIFILYLISNFAFGQFYHLSDSLTSPNPQWTGDTAWMNYTKQGLQSNAPSAGSLIWKTVKSSRTKCRMASKCLNGF
jgi:hypothetical protein